MSAGDRTSKSERVGLRTDDLQMRLIDDRSLRPRVLDPEIFARSLLVFKPFVNAS